VISPQLPALLILIPLVAAPLCVIARHSTISWWLAFLANLFSVFASWQVLQHVSDVGVIRYAVGGWAAPTGIEYYIDSLNASVRYLSANTICCMQHGCYALPGCWALSLLVMRSMYLFFWKYHRWRPTCLFPLAATSER